ncbi:MAG TPA: AAA family ATPase [Ilumatobacteraceae bacterium]|nr:AAA family ATPase [Ilumatobacteraceae bacterium]
MGKASMIYEFDECVLDTAKQQLWRGGEPIHVEPQVLAVITYLVANHDRVVPKIELLDEVWESRYVSESALTSRIKLARKACGDSGREQRIVKTIHSRGYRCVADVVQCDEFDPVGTRPEPPRQPGSSSSVRALSTGAFRRSSTTLFGRDRELDALSGALAAAVGGQRGAVFVRGGMGMGKSSLISEFVERHDELADWHVARGRCIQMKSGPEPYFPLFDALSHLARSNAHVVTVALDRAAPSWLAQLPSLLDDAAFHRLERRLLGATPARMLREGVDAIEALALDRPLLLVVEDLQWADECTLGLLDHLLLRSGPASLLLLGTCRGSGSQAASVIEPAAAQGRATLIELEPLAVEDVRALVGDRLGGAAIDDDIVSIVAERSGGVPLFVEEIVTTLTREHRLAIGDGVVTASGPPNELASTVPASLPVMIERELTAIDPACLTMLEVAAVAGQHFDAATVAAALDRPVPDTEDLLAELARDSALIGSVGASVWPNGTVSADYTFAHDLYRHVVYDRVSPGRRALFHGRIGDALEAGYGDQVGSIAVVLADHFVQAGGTIRAVRYLTRAGEQANARNAHQYGQRFLADALDLLDRVPPGTDRDRLELTVRISLGSSLVATMGWFDESVSANYERCLELSANDDRLVVEQAAARYGLATVSELQGRFERTEMLLTPLLTDDQLVIEAHELVACSMFHQGAFARSLATANTVLDRWDEDTYSVEMARIAEHPASSCNSWSSLASWALGRSDESLALAERAVELGERNLYALSTAVQQRAMLHQIRHEPALCIEWSDRCRQVADDQQFPMRMVQADIYKGWALGVTGSVELGLALVADGIERFRTAGAMLNEAYYLGLHADVLLHGGDPVRALVLLDQAFERMRASTRSYFFESELHRLRARGFTDGDESVGLDAARAELDRSLEVAAAQGSKAFELRTTIARVELETEHGDPEAWRSALGELLTVWTGQAPTPDVERARALIA